MKRYWLSVVLSVPLAVVAGAGERQAAEDVRQYLKGTGTIGARVAHALRKADALAGRAARKHRHPIAKDCADLIHATVAGR